MDPVTDISLAARSTAAYLEGFVRGNINDGTSADSDPLVFADGAIVTGGRGGRAGIFNIRVGNGSNVLKGRLGRRKLLIAGVSASTLLGGDDGDMLIAGRTA
jgi:hypothetical protein